MAEATHWTNAWTTFANSEKTWGYRQDQLPSTHPISADIRDIEDVEVNFDGITYAKGASVLKQLVAWVGRDAFVDGVRSYFDKYAWGNTELIDLLGALEQTSGRDLSSWAKEWLETAGLNTLRPDFEVDAEGRFTSFDIVQSAPDAATRPSARTGSRSDCTSTARVASFEPDESSSTSSGSEPPSTSWSVQLSPTLCSSTTTTSPTPRSASTSDRRKPLSTTSGD